MSVWIVAAASSAVWPRRSVHAARLRLAGGEERDQAERLEQPADDLVERRLAVAESGRLLLGQFGQLGLELQVDPAGPFTTGDHRLGGQRLELGRQLALPVAQRASRVQRARARAPAPPPRREASGRPTSPASRPARAAARRGRGRPRAARARALEVALRIGAGREAVDDGEQRVDPAQVAEQLRPRPGHVGDARPPPPSPSSRADDRRELAEPLVRDRRHADVLLAEVRPHAARVSTLKSVVFPAAGRPTIPASSI